MINKVRKRCDCSEHNSKGVMCYTIFEQEYYEGKCRECGKIIRVDQLLLESIKCVGE